MSSYWKERKIVNKIDKIAYNIWILIDSNTGHEITKCYCTSISCLVISVICNATNHYCICNVRQLITDRPACFNMCKSKNHHCIHGSGLLSNNCKSKHLGSFICKCPDENSVCEYDSDSDFDSNIPINHIKGHICICTTQDPNSCLAKIHSCSCKNAAFGECLYERPSEWPKSLPIEHKHTIKNIIYMQLDNFINERGILDIIHSYCDNADGEIHSLKMIRYDPKLNLPNLEISKNKPLLKYISDIKKNNSYFDSNIQITNINNEVKISY